MKEGLVVFDVSGAKFSVGFVSQSFKSSQATSSRISTTVVGCNCGENRHAVGAAHMQRARARQDVPSFGEHADTRHISNALCTVAMQVFEGATVEDESVAALDCHFAGEREVPETEVATDGCRLIAGETGDQDIGGIGRKDFALEAEFAA